MRDRPVDGMGGAVLYLPRDTVFKICDQYDLTVDTFDKILITDEIFVSAWRNKQSEKRKEQQIKAKHGRRQHK